MEKSGVVHILIKENQMAVTLKENVYGLTGTGKRVRIAHVTEVEPDLFPVGGKIFYIDPNSQEVVEFYDQYGEIIENVQIGDTPYAYKIISPDPNGIDKYYVYYDKLYTSKRWTYYENGAYVYNSLGTANGIGKGKTNTALVMAADEGKYVTPNSNGQATIWYTIKEMRDNKVAGCDDWFVPSESELGKLREAIGFKKQPDADPAPTMTAGPVTGGVIAGVADGAEHKKSYSGNTTYYPSNTKFLDSYIWCSNEYSAQFARYWRYNDQSFSYGKYDDFSLCAVRAF